MVPLRNKLAIILKKGKAFYVGLKSLALWFFYFYFVIWNLCLTYAWFWVFLIVENRVRSCFICAYGLLFLFCFLESIIFRFDFWHKAFLISFIGFDNVFDSWKLYPNYIWCQFHSIFLVDVRDYNSLPFNFKNTKNKK